MTASQNSAKDVIYIDVDDEITAIIEKLQDSTGKIVALVLPKRATAFQSIVNMKLLKRTAASSKKNIVLITSEQGILPLAGAVGLHVASTLQSKPTIPNAPVQSDAPVSVDEIEVGEVEEEPTNKSRAAAGATAAGAPKPDDEEETIELDNDDAAAGAVAGTAAKKPYNKKLKVPDFNKFRNKLILGGAALLLLIVGFIFATIVLPKATVTLKINTTEVPGTISATSSPAFTELNEEAGNVPGALKEFKKTEVQKAAATGQKDLGTKAEGSVTLSLSDCSKEQVTVPAGTVLSSSNLNFVTDIDINYIFGRVL